MKNLTFSIITLFFLISCNSKDVVTPDPNVRGLTFAGSFQNSLKYAESIDTISVWVRNQEKIKLFNVFPIFKDHYMYLNTTEIDLNNCVQSSISRHEKKITEFKIYLEK
jgi:hypothetical protein